MTTETLNQRWNFELAIWLGALFYLGFVAPNLGFHLPFCIPSLLGIDFCWGCGVGTSISQALHGDFGLSLSTHPIGMVAAGFIFYRIYTLATQKRPSVPAFSQTEADKSNADNSNT